MSYYTLTKKSGDYPDMTASTPNYFIGRQLGFSIQKEMLNSIRTRGTWENKSWLITRYESEVPDGPKLHRCTCQYCKELFMSPIRSRTVCENIICQNDHDTIQEAKQDKYNLERRIAAGKTKPIRLSPMDLFAMGKIGTVSKKTNEAKS